MSDVVVSAYYTHDHDKGVILRTAADADALVDELLRQPFDNSVAALYADTRPKAASGYPDHELRIAIDIEANIGGIRYTGGDSDATAYVAGATSEREEMFYLYMSHDEGWPKDSAVTFDQVRQAVKEFIEGNGTRPTGFEWREWPEGVR
jgi:hypothetical protein